MAGSSLSIASRAGATVLVLMAAALLCGCEDGGYDVQIAYGARRDPILLERPATKNPERIDPPGQLDTLRQEVVAAGGKLLEPSSLPAEARGELTKLVDATFGTPAKPKIGEETNKDTRLDPETLAEGSRLYRRHCLHCHGLSGDGKGPTGPWVNPHPRDYRQGLFKFTSSGEGDLNRRRPLREDLRRTIKTGIDGTSMPSFATLEDNEVEAIVSYVVHLSIRGKVEVDLLRKIKSDDLTAAEEIKEEFARFLDRERKAWDNAEKVRIAVAPPPKYVPAPGQPVKDEDRGDLHKSIERGAEQFLVGKGGCVGCHNDFGRANDYRYDDWGTIVRPANLTAGMYRGGRRPIDLYYRIHSGVPGAGMPAGTTLKPDEVWDIVNFIHALPYPNMLPEKVREQVYGKK